MSYWLLDTSVTKSGYHRLEDIERFELTESTSTDQNGVQKTIHYVKAYMRRDNKSYPVTFSCNSKEEAKKELQMIMQADPKYVVKYGEKRSSIDDLSAKLDALADLIKYRPGGPVFNEKLEQMTAKFDDQEEKRNRHRHRHRSSKKKTSEEDEDEDTSFDKSVGN